MLSFASSANLKRFWVRMLKKNEPKYSAITTDNVNHGAVTEQAAIPATISIVGIIQLRLIFNFLNEEWMLFLTHWLYGWVGFVAGSLTITLKFLIPTLPSLCSESP